MRTKSLQQKAMTEWDYLIIKEIDEPVSSSTTLQNDDELNWAVLTGELWRIQALIIYTADTGDYKWDFAISTGTATWQLRYTGESIVNAFQNSTALNNSTANATGASNGGGATSILRTVFIEGYVKADNDGTVSFRFAEDNSVVSPSTTKAGSLLWLKKLGTGT